MASQLVSTKWPVHDNMPDFYSVLEDATEHFGKLRSPKFTDYINPIGIEVEAEGWQNKEETKLKFWDPREDGSLKDHGIEFVSSILSGVLIDYALKELEETFSWHEKKLGPISWSHRTSIHVHVNLRDLPVIKLKWLIAYYALTEPLWYKYCDEKRIGNSFCFPVCSMNPRLIKPGKEWPKYCGLNLGSSLVQFNTVEFRQMHGHQNFKLYRIWIKQICDFINYIYHTPCKLLRLQMEEYLKTGNLKFKGPFGEFLTPEVKTEIYDNAKWVADFVYKGSK
jgi:hypothetical protein